MKSITPEKPSYYSSSIPVVHGWFRLQGGVSRFADADGVLNGKTGDWDPLENVESNWQIAAKALESRSPLIRIEHNFGTNIAVVDDSSEHILEDYDAIVTSSSSVAIGQRTADCGNILLYCPEPRAIALIHGSYHTLAAAIIAKTIDLLVERGCKPADIQAALGPMICGGCYEFGPEATELFASKYINQLHDGSLRLDLVACSIDQLKAAGVRDIEPPAVCTYEDKSLASARREGDQSPRMITMAQL